MNTPTAIANSVGAAGAAPTALSFDEEGLARLAEQAVAAFSGRWPARGAAGGLGGAPLPGHPAPPPLPTGAVAGLGWPGPEIGAIPATPQSPAAAVDAARGAREAPREATAYSPTLAPLVAPSRPGELAPEAIAGGAIPAQPDGSGLALAAVAGPETHGLPGAEDLRRLLAGVLERPLPRENLAADATPAYYFLEGRPGRPGGLSHEATAREPHPGFDVQAVRRDFPILAERVHGRPLVWLDNAATTQKPTAVIERLAHFYRHENSNIHRAAHELAARATQAYEDARRTVARFLGAGSQDEIVFVRGTTEAINLVAQSWGRANVGEGDEILVSLLEHHANIVPWQQLAAATGARIRVIPVDAQGQILLGEYRKLLSERTRLVAVSQVSNALGTITPVQEIVELAHRAGARVLVDGAQSVAHLRVDLRALGADFFAFSGHKIFGPTGIGALYGKAEVLESMEPWQGGGNMIADVTFERTLYQGPPARFEAGTPNIADAVGLAAALEYVERLGLENIARYEHDLLAYGTAALQSVPGLRLVGTAPDKASVLAFVLEGYAPAEVGAELNREGIAVRAGHHCAQPIVRHFGHEATVRPSLAFYNTVEELDLLARVLRRLARGKPTVPAPGGAPAFEERRRSSDWSRHADPAGIGRLAPDLPGAGRIGGLGVDALEGLLAP